MEVQKIAVVVLTLLVVLLASGLLRACKRQPSTATFRDPSDVGVVPTRPKVRRPPRATNPSPITFGTTTDPAPDANSPATQPAVPDLPGPGTHKLPDGSGGRLSLHACGYLVITGGRILACDPLVPPPEGSGFSAPVPPGRYPVVLGVLSGNWGDRPAYAAVRLTPTHPVRWELATRPGQDVSTLKPGEILGYPVDAGMGCFMDADALPAWNKLNGDWGGAFVRQIRPEEERHAAEGGWVNVVVDSATRRNVIAFPSGLGDGFYASYWGLDAAGKPACLVTDFGLLELPEPLRATSRPKSP